MGVGDMTPLAMKVANELTLPKAKRTFDDAAHVLDLFDQDMHCFEVSAISKSVDAVLGNCESDDEIDESWSVWRDIETMLPRLFLPSPVTWLEQVFHGNRFASVLQKDEDTFSLITVHDGPNGGCSVPMCKFRARDVLEAGDDRIEVSDVYDEPEAPAAPEFNLATILKSIDLKSATPEQARSILEARNLAEMRVNDLGRAANRLSRTLDFLGAANRFIGMVVLTLDLINTPGLIGLRQRDPHRGFARRLAALRGGSYPLHSWSEVVLKHQTRIAEPGERLSGTTYHKCLHFVRSHLRHYRDGKVVTIPAHWRGDPALGIKRTRYRMAA